MHCEVSTFPAATAAGRHRVEHRAARDRDIERLEATLVERNRPVDQGAKDIQHGRHAHSAGRVEVVCVLRRRAREIDVHPPGGAIDFYTHCDDRPLGPSRSGRPRVATVRWLPACAQVVLHMTHVGAHGVETVPLHGAFDFSDATRVGSQLGTKVRDILVGPARGIASGRKGSRSSLSRSSFAVTRGEEFEENALLSIVRLKGGIDPGSCHNVGVMGA